MPISPRSVCCVLFLVGFSAACPQAAPAAPQGLAKEAAEAAIAERFAARKAQDTAALRAELEAAAIRVGEHELKLLTRRFGEAKEGERSLYISLHGGGGAPPRVNDQQWRNQIRLYEPKEGFVVAPRAPGNTWNLWHVGEIDGLFDRLIAAYVIVHGVDPDRVHILGYSAGGDGVYQLAPRMADRFASAAMMAGHPNETVADGLRNLPFFLFMGGKDDAHGRAATAAVWAKDLAARRAADPEGYPHRVQIYPDKGHWMDGQDREVLPWMAAERRRAWPKRVVWRQDDVRHPRFYWLRSEGPSEPGREVIQASVVGQRINLEAPADRKLTLALRDELIDLDQPVQVFVGAELRFSGRVPRTLAAIEQSLAERPDPRLAATALLTVPEAKPRDR